MKNPDSSTAFPVTVKHPIFVGDSYDTCSVDDFLAHMPESESARCQVFRKWEAKSTMLGVFWYPTGTNEPEPNDRSVYSGIGAKARSIQWKIMSLLLSMSHGNSHTIFVQFWTPTKSKSGQSMLTVVQHPFAMGNLYKGYCRYRYACMEWGIRVEDNIAGPVGRVFTRGYPECSRNLEFYSREDFPMWDSAKLSGQYLALPIFEDGTQNCIGVLEYFSTYSGGTFSYSLIMERLQRMGLSCTRLRHKDCHKVNRSLLISTVYKDVLDFVRIDHKLPMIQIWIPCFCDKTGSITRLFCRWTSWESYRLYDILRKGEGNPANGWHYVESGKGLVGRAYSQKKSCFLGDTSQLSVSEYPVVHSTRSCGLTACLAIPVQSLDPRLHDLILEVFLPPQDNSDHENVGLMLQSLLSAMAQSLHRCSTPRYYEALLPLKLEENREFYVQYSHSDSENFVYFDVSQQDRYVGTCKTLGNGREGHHFQPSRKNNHQNYGIGVVSLNKAKRSRESFANGDAENVDGDPVQSHDILGSSRVKEEQLSSPDHSPATVSNSNSNVQEKAEALTRFANAAVKFEGLLPPSKKLELLNLQSATRLQETGFVEVSGKVTQEAEIGTLSNKRARENEPSYAKFILASTMGKGIATEVYEPEMAECPNKRPKENANSVSRGAIGKAIATGNDEIGCCLCNNAGENEVAAAKSVSLGDDEGDRRHSMINVMATYKDDTILFPLSSNSGIKELRTELDDAFQFGAEKFKVKYKHDDGIWITLLRDKDFRFHIDTLKTLGQSTVKVVLYTSETNWGCWST